MKYRSLADELAVLSTQAEDLELEYNKLREHSIELGKELNNVSAALHDLEEEHEAAVAELMWFRAAYPDGQTAYHVSERVSG
jgi:chromosome segregation ATPase